MVVCVFYVFLVGCPLLNLEQNIGECRIKSSRGLGEGREQGEGEEGEEGGEGGREKRGKEGREGGSCLWFIVVTRSFFPSCFKVFRSFQKFSFPFFSFSNMRATTTYM